MYTDRYIQEKDGGSLRKFATSWAPINYQYISLNDNEYKVKKDLLCQVNFPSSKSKNPYSAIWDTTIVRDRLEKAKYEDLVPVAYYSVAVTETHYFVLYSFYHADDDDHPNDLEGCLVILEKNEQRSTLLGMICVAHFDFIPFVYGRGMEIRNHPVWQHGFKAEAEEEQEGDHVIIQQEQGKHGMYALGQNIAWQTKLKRRVLEIFGRSEDCLVYFPGDTPNRYEKKRLELGKGNPHNPTFYYKLIDIMDKKEGLYERYKTAKGKGNETFTSEGQFHTTTAFHANLPWIWEPKEFLVNEIKKGAMWYYPAELAEHMFRLPENKSFKTKYLKKFEESNE